MNYSTMIGEYGQLVTDEPVEVQKCRKITYHFRGYYRMYHNFMKENLRMSTCNWLDLQTLRSQLLMPKNLPDLCYSRGAYAISTPSATYRELEFG